MANNAPKLFKRTALFALTTLCMHSATAGVVRDDINYQQFRDFAENKGKFAVGASNIEILDKNGNVVETMLVDGIVMPDWSAVSAGSTHQADSQGGNKGLATLIHPQYIVGVAHNRSYRDVQFGVNDNKNPDNKKFSYKLVKYHNFSDADKTFEKEVYDTETTDYNHPRLHKLVTEIVPIDTVNNQATLRTQDELLAFKKRYPLLLRIGAGRQALHKVNDEPKNLWNAYFSDKYETPDPSLLPTLANSNYLIGGYSLPSVVSYYSHEYLGLLATMGKLTDKNISKMTAIGLNGDSGSPIYAYDTVDKKWKFIGTYALVIAFSDGDEMHYYWTLNKHNFNEQKRTQDTAGEILENNKILTWTPNGQEGTSRILFDGGLLSVDLYNPKLKEEEDDIETLNMKNREQKVLSRQHHGKTFILNGENNVLHLTDNINQGAGAIYFNGNTIVKGKNNNITWLGAGVSVAKDKTVTWQIKNPENDRLSKIGEGTLLVNGTGDNKGDISVGDGTVILNQKDGKAFNKVGIVSGRPVVKLDNDKQVNPNDIYFGYRGGRLDLNGNHLSFDYIQNVDSGAMIVNHNPNQSATITLKTDATDKYKSAFNGVFGETNKDFFGNPLQDKNYHNGVLNVIYNPDSPQSDKTFLLSGGTNLNGDLTVEKGNLLLSGRPTPHAYDHLKSIEPFQDDDWIDRTFTAKNFIVNNDGKLTVGRNVSKLNGNVILKDKATGEIGYVNNQTSICVRSDYFGLTDCQTKNYDDAVLKTIPTTKVTGDMTLNNESQLTFGKAHLLGKVTADDKTALTLGKESQWTMTGDSTTGDLNLQDGSTIHLNANYDKATTALYNVLTVGGKLTGNGKFNYLTNLAEQQGDKVIVKGIASGTHTLNVKDTGKEPFSPKDLVLLDLQNTNQTNEHLTVKLTNAQNGKETVDLGAWRYELAQVGNQFVLMDKRHKNALSKYTNQALSAKYAQLNNAFSATNGITAHLWNAPKYKGIWATVERDDRTLESPVFRNYDSEHTLTQLGVDETVDVRQGQLLVGTALSYGKGVQTFDDGKGESELMLGSAYGKWTSPKNAFVSFDLGLGQGTQHLTLTDKVKPKHTFAHFGLGVGKTWQTGNFTATPSLAVRQYHFGGDRYAMDGANIAYGKANILSYQPSIRLGYQLNTQSGLALRPYLASTYTHTDDKAKVQVNTHQFTVPFADTWQHKVGLEAQKGKLYGQLYASQEQGDHIKDGQKIGLSVGYGW